MTFAFAFALAFGFGSAAAEAAGRLKEDGKSGWLSVSSGLFVEMIDGRPGLLHWMSEALSGSRSGVPTSPGRLGIGDGGGGGWLGSVAVGFAAAGRFKSFCFLVLGSVGGATLSGAPLRPNIVAGAPAVSEAGGRGSG